MPRQITLTGFLLLAFCPAVARAIPAFARRTGMSCGACHDAWPRLNDFGENYRDRGYQTTNWDNATWNKLLDAIPVSFRATPVYRFTSSTNQATDQGPRTVSTGGFQVEAADVYFGSALSRHVSTYVDIAGFGPEGVASLESAWVRFNELGSQWVNVKLGVMELDLPESAHRSFTIFTPFLSYGFHPSGSINPFDLGENQFGVELSGHAAGPGLRYNLALTTGSDVQSANWFSAPLTYGHLTYTHQNRSSWVSRIRGGVFGLVGWRPTTFATTSESGVPEPIPGTWGNNQSYERTGADLHLTFGSPSTPLTLSAVWMWGREAGALIANGTRSASYQGGLVQLDYAPDLFWVFGIRFDGAYNIQQGDSSIPSNAGQQTAFTAFLRYFLWSSSTAGVALHLEGSTLRTLDAGPEGLPVRATNLFIGADFLL